MECSVQQKDKDTVLRFGVKHPKQRPFQKKYTKHYEPLYGTPACTYEGNKRGRKSLEERQKQTLKKEIINIVIYFD